MEESEKEAKIKCVRSDRGGEFTSDEFKLFCDNYLVCCHYICYHTSSVNMLQHRGDH